MASPDRRDAQSLGDRRDAGARLLGRVARHRREPRAQGRRFDRVRVDARAHAFTRLAGHLHRLEHADAAAIAGAAAALATARLANAFARLQAQPRVAGIAVEVLAGQRPARLAT